MVDGALAEPVGGLVALVRLPDGQTVLATHGYAEAGRPIDRDDSFRVASVTKTYVAALVLSLEEDGLLTVDDQVADHLPALGVDERITIRQLLTHSSGLAITGPRATWRRRTALRARSPPRRWWP